MSAKYTPGPWYARGESVEAQRPHVCGGTNHESVFALARDPAERRANAVLCAAAPDLLAVLRALVDAARESHMPGDRGSQGMALLLATVAAAEPIIARAEGGTR